MPEYNKKYKRVVVFSGGGTRFAIYCGMYAAMQDMNIAPDLVIGACGGAVATTIINSFDTDEKRKDYLKSEELYRFIHDTRLTDERKLSRMGWYALKKRLNRANAPYIENVFDRYLVDMPEDISAQLPSLSADMGHNINSIIVGSQILFDKMDANQPRNRRKLYRKILFTDEKTALSINPETIKIESDNYINSAVESQIELTTDIPMHIAMRISLSDMFYVQPVYYRGIYYAGGAIDLMPVELAQSLADCIIMEKKKGYTGMEDALVRAVLGYGGNKRLADVNKRKIDYWINTSDMEEALHGHYCRKIINLTKFRIDITLPLSHQQFAEDMELQWQYGYNKVKQQFAK